MAKQLRNFTNENHIVLIVHGTAGEMMRSIDLFGLNFPNLNAAVCRSMRTHHSEVHTASALSQPRGDGSFAGRVARDVFDSFSRTGERLLGRPSKLL